MQNKFERCSDICHRRAAVFSLPPNRLQSCSQRFLTIRSAASHHRPPTDSSGSFRPTSRSTTNANGNARHGDSNPSGQRSATAATKGGQHGAQGRSMQHGPSSATSNKRKPPVPGAAASARQPQVLPPAGKGSSAHSAQSRGQAGAGSSTQSMIEPMSQLDVDQELWQVLDLCSESELEAVYAVLHGPSPFSPLVKSLVAEKEPALVELRGRLSLMHKIEARFRFLAADPGALLRGARPSYRETLVAIRDRLDVPCSTNLSTYDLETEIFLHLLKHCVEYVRGEHEVVDSDEAAAAAFAHEGDGMSAAASAKKGHNWVERVTAPVMFGLKELVPTLVKFGSAMTVTAVGRTTAQQLATQLLASHVKYQAALRAAGAAATSSWGKAALLDVAQQGLTSATARYATLKGALSFLGPVMWGWLAADLALKAIGTDYGRVIRAVFILAQVRLIRTHGFVPGGGPQPQGGPSATASATASWTRAAGATASSTAAAQQQRYRGVQPVVPVTYDVMVTPVTEGEGVRSHKAHMGSVTEITDLSEEDEVRLDEDEDDDPYRNPDHIIN